MRKKEGNEQAKKKGAREKERYGKVRCPGI